MSNVTRDARCSSHRGCRRTGQRIRHAFRPGPAVARDKLRVAVIGAGGMAGTVWTAP